MTATLDSNFRLACFMTATQAILVNFLINNFNFNFNLNLKNLDFNFNLARFMTASQAILKNFLLSNLNLFLTRFPSSLKTGCIHVMIRIQMFTQQSQEL